MQKQPSWRGRSWSEAPEITTTESLYDHLLRRAGCTTPAEIESFLRPRLSDLPDPFGMKGAPQAAERIKTALDAGERIIVFGDFDTDGITATTILVHGLRRLGAAVSYRIPDRAKDSHGLKNHLLDEIIATGTTLLITCDCGINDHAEVAYAAQQGLDVIITDHHHSDPARFPAEAVAVVNPQQSGCPYPSKGLSGSAVAFKLLSALAVECLPAAEVGDFLDPYLELCAIGLIADCMELTGENRQLAHFGLAKLKETRWPGLRQLLKDQDVDPRNISEETVGFTIAPRLNAASRIGDVLVAAQLFLGDPTQHPVRLVKLETYNNERRELTTAALRPILRGLEAKPVHFLHDDNWTPGILGLIAGRVAEHTSAPTIATTRIGAEIHASCRSPRSGSIITALQANAELFTHFGGHHEAAGFRLPAAHLPVLEQKLTTYYRATPVTAEQADITATLSPELLNLSLAEFLAALGPFGVGHPAPVFRIKSAELVEVKRMGQHQNHARILFSAGGQLLTAVAFFAESLLPHLREGNTADLLLSVSKSTWRGQERLELRLLDGR